MAWLSKRLSICSWQIYSSQASYRQIRSRAAKHRSLSTVGLRHSQNPLLLFFIFFGKPEGDSWTIYSEMRVRDAPPCQEISCEFKECWAKDHQTRLSEVLRLAVVLKFWQGGSPMGLKGGRGLTGWDFGAAPQSSRKRAQDTSGSLCDSKVEKDQSLKCEHATCPPSSSSFWQDNLVFFIPFSFFFFLHNHLCKSKKAKNQIEKLKVRFFSLHWRIPHSM